MAADLTAYDAILKEDYAPAIVEQMNNASVLLKRLQRNEEAVQGKEVYIPLHTRRNVGIGSRGENEALPTAGKQGYIATKFPVKHHYGTIRISGPLIRTANSNKAAFTNALDAEIQGMATDFIQEVNRMLFGDGKGTLTTANVMGTAGLTVPVDSTKYLQPDMVIDIVNASTGNPIANGSARTIASVGENSITLSGSGDVQTSDGDLIVRTGSYNKEINGLSIIVSNAGALQNIDPTVVGNEFWKANVLANGGTARSLSEVLMQTAFDTTEQKGGKVSLVVTSYGGRRAYLNLLTSLKRFQNTLQLEGGFTALDFNGLPLVVDKDAPTGKYFFLDERHLTIYQVGSPAWAELDGAVLSRVSGYDAYEAYYYWDAEFGTDMRAAHTLLADITEA